MRTARRDRRRKAGTLRARTTAASEHGTPRARGSDDLDVLRLLVEREVGRDLRVPHGVLRGVLEADEHLAGHEQRLVVQVVRQLVEYLLFAVLQPREQV